MKPIVHWLMPEATMSGLISYTYQQHFAAIKLGYDSHICYFTQKDGCVAQFPQSRIPEVKASPHSVADGAINIIHNLASPFKLDNMVFELHGMPQWIIRDMDSLATCCGKLDRADVLLTRFPSHVPYWQELTEKPIHVIPPGVDLDYWKPEGKKIEFGYHPTILWADSWREGVKEPWDLLYAMKIVARENPAAKLKLVNIPSYYRDILHYFIGRLKLDNVIDWPIEGQVKNIDEYYRGADMVYCPLGIGNNVAWEATACGCVPVHEGLVEIDGDHLVNSDKHPYIANGILAQWDALNKYPGIRGNMRDLAVKEFDINNSVKAMVEVFELAF